MQMVENLIECLAGSNGTILDMNFLINYKEFIPSWWFTLEYMPAVWAAIGSILVGLSGVLPLLVIPIDQTDNLKQGDSAKKLKTLLSFAVGGLLGDVFLHSLPEIWAKDMARNGGHPTKTTGLWILTGLIAFVIAEKSFGIIGKYGQDTSPTKQKHDEVATNNNFKGVKLIEPDNKKQLRGYMNLLSNMIDNFTHGLSLGGAFLVSLRLGLLTTFAILVHEIPHEVGDFAILLKSGFTRMDAAFYQLVTAGGGMVGSLAAIMSAGAANAIEARTSWIIPFTAGTFLHIALVTVLPDLLKEDDPKESFKQLLALIVGIFVMAFAATAFD